jgi:hypothetical protein
VSTREASGANRWAGQPQGRPNSVVVGGNQLKGPVHSTRRLAPSFLARETRPDAARHHHHGEYSSALSRTAPARATLSGRRLLFFFPRPCPWRPTRGRPDKVEGDGAGAAPSTYRAMLSGKTGPLLYCKCSTLPTAKAGQSFRRYC